MKAYDFAKQMKFKLEIENILHKNKVQSTMSYLSLVHQGKFEDLIKDLYQNEYKNCNVNKAANEIARIVDDPQIVNLTLIKYKLLDTWLPEEDGGTNFGSNLDETVTNFNLIQSLQTKDQKTENRNDDQENYWRCVYILQVSLFFIIFVRFLGGDPC